MKWDWKSVEKDGLPEPSGNDVYLVLHPLGIATGTFDYIYESIELDKPIEIAPGYFRNSDLIKTDKAQWYLDFDGCGHEDEITHYIKIEYPEEEEC